MSPQELAAIAIEAEACGFDVIALVDHVVHPEDIHGEYTFSEDGTRPWDETALWPEPFAMMSYLAAKTNQIEFMTAIFVLPMRNPFLVAQHLSTISQLAQRKIWFGIGSGWSSDEFRLMRQDFGNRGNRGEEMVEILRKLWTGEMVEHHGEYYDFDRLVMLPRPASDIPILFGGEADVALRRAARIGNGWISPPWPVSKAVGTVERLKLLLIEEGRESEPFEFVLVASDWSEQDEMKRAEDAGIDNILCSNPWLNRAFIPGGTDDTSGLQTKIEGVRHYADMFIAPGK